MNAPELSRCLDSARPPLLLHVLPEEIFAARRIRGSLNACVYETAFLDRVASIIPDRSASIIVYGAGGGSLDASVAAEKLRAAGYENVDLFADGLAGWQAAGLACEGNQMLPEPPVLNGIYHVDISDSVIRWTGRNLFNQHYGTVRLASGEIHIREGQLVSARFSVDMGSIACDDLTDSHWNAMLIGHLKTADFFEVDRFPTADLIADSVQRIDGRIEGTPDYLIQGSLTLRGVTRSLEFPAVIASADGRRLTAQTQFEIDRTEFGSIYGSEKFFHFLGKHVVSDRIHLHVMVHADLADS